MPVVNVTEEAHSIVLNKQSELYEKYKDKPKISDIVSQCIIKGIDLIKIK